ncbi:hypothetical protein [Nocardia sp. NPDC003963]
MTANLGQLTDSFNAGIDTRDATPATRRESPYPCRYRTRDQRRMCLDCAIVLRATHIP